MSPVNRRQFLGGLGAAALAAAPAQMRAGQGVGNVVQPAHRLLPLSEYQPKSMLHVKQTKVARARFPVIDVHAHLSFAAANKNGVPLTDQRRYPAPPEELLPVMDRRNLRTLVDLTGGYGAGLEECIAKFHKPYPDRFLVFTEPDWTRSNQPGYSQYQADAIASAQRAGARGLKVLKTLGLYLRENITGGPLVKVDDRRFDAMWEACAALKMPVAIHTADPEAFFLPTDRFNERFEELNNHPDWSFYDKDYPSFRELMEARNRVFARHPKTTFIALHVGHDAENLGYVSECMDQFPNMHVEIGARLNELGRQPRASRKFFEKYQDRIMFGTDAVPHGVQTPQQIFGDELYEIYFRFLETDDEYFDYAPAPTPPQGRWRIYGVYLPETILKKVYNENAARLLNVRV